MAVIITLAASDSDDNLFNITCQWSYLQIGSVTQFTYVFQCTRYVSLVLADNKGSKYIFDI